MDEITRYKTEFNDGVLEFEFIKPNYLDVYTDKQLTLLEEQGKVLDLVEADLDEQISILNSKIDNLTNKSDGIDYAVAISCGFIAGLIDIFFIGEFDFKTAKSSVDKAFEDFVNNRAKNIKIDEAIEKARNTYKEKGQTLTKEKIAEIRAGVEKRFANKPSLSSSIKTLEDKYKIPSDNLWLGKDAGISAKSHHLDDLAHHPTIVGLAASILTQFTKQSYFQNSEGIPFIFDIDSKELIGNGLKEKLVCGVINWLGHLVSDMAGSNSSARKGNPGMGLPGPFISTLKELSMLPILNKTKLPQIANDLFTNDNAIFGEFRMDMRSEMAIAKELTKQSIPVFLDQVLIRTFYFIRRLIMHSSNAHSLKEIPWKDVLPFGNRTVTRMSTISLATMEAIDITDVTIRGAIDATKAGVAGAGAAAVTGTAAFFKTFALRVNYVGIGSLALSGFVDTSMGCKREKLISERIAIYNKMLSVENARLYFKEAEVWITAERAGQSIEEAYKMIEAAEEEINSSVKSIMDNMDKIGEHIDAAEKKNPGLKEDMLNTLKWGI